MLDRQAEEKETVATAEAINAAEATEPVAGGSTVTATATTATDAAGLDGATEISALLEDKKTK